MTDAPERIWAYEQISREIELRHWSRVRGSASTEYIRADVAQAMVAAAYERDTPQGFFFDTRAALARIRADRIEALQAEALDWRAQVGELSDKCKALEAEARGRAEALVEIDRLREALRPFASYVDKESCRITMIWEDGDYKSTYTNTLKPKYFFDAFDALYPRALAQEAEG